MAALLWSRRCALAVGALPSKAGTPPLAKTSELNDYSVCTTWGVERENYYLIDVFRRRLNYPDLKRAIVSHAERFDADKIVIEGKSSGTQLSRDFPERLLPGIVVEAVNAATRLDKVMRLHARSDRFESGRVVLPRSAPWLDEYVLSSLAFGAPNTDDRGRL